MWNSPLLLLNCWSIVTRLLVSRIGNILRKRKHDHNRASGFKWLKNWIKEYYNIPGMARRIFALPFVFLVFYYIIQCLYQFDIHVICSVDHYKLNSTLTSSIKECRKNNKDRFDLWAKERTSYLSLLTFLLGFYVSNIVSRWSQQVSAHLEPYNITIFLKLLTFLDIFLLFSDFLMIFLDF